MKKILIIIICMFAFISMPKALIEKGYEIESGKDDMCDLYEYFSISKSRDGGFFTLGECIKEDKNDPSANLTHLPIVKKYDKNGKVIWKSIIEHPLMYMRNIIESNDGNIYVAYTSWRDGPFYGLLKLDGKGNYIFDEHISDFKIGVTPSIIVFKKASDGNIILVTNENYYKLKKENNGNLIITEKIINKENANSNLKSYDESMSNGNFIIEEVNGNKSKTTIYDENFNVVKSKEHTNVKFVSGYISSDKLFSLYETTDKKTVIKEYNSNLEEVNSINLSNLNGITSFKLINFHDNGYFILHLEDSNTKDKMLMTYYNKNNKIKSVYKFDAPDYEKLKEENNSMSYQLESILSDGLVLDNYNIVNLSKFTIKGSYEEGSSSGIIPELPIVFDLVSIIGNKLLFEIKSDTSENGKIELSKTKAAYKDEISVNVKPKFGYKVIGVDVKTDDGEMITLNNNKFIMPASDVIVSVKYEKTGIINPKTGVYSVGIVFIVVLISSLISYMIIKIKENKII